MWSFLPLLCGVALIILESSEGVVASWKLAATRGHEVTRISRFSCENRMKMTLGRGARETSKGLRHVSATARYIRLPHRGSCQKKTLSVFFWLRELSFVQWFIKCNSPQNSRISEQNSRKEAFVNENYGNLYGISKLFSCLEKIKCGSPGKTPRFIGLTDGKKRNGAPQRR